MANTFSIAMCTYDGARYLGEQLASIAAQTRPPDELVVCDDRSRDETTTIVRRFAQSAPFPVHLHVNEQNLGSTRNFEKAVRLCAGDLIALSDQDDVWMPRKLELIEAVFTRAPGVGLVFTDAEVVDETLRPLGYRLWDKVGFDGEMRRRVRGGRALDVLLPGWTVTGATMAFRSKFRDLALEIPDDLSMIHDGWIALVVASVSDVAFIAEPLIEYRQHPRQQIGAPKGDAGQAEGVKSLEDIRAAINRGNRFDELIENGGRIRQRLVARRDRFDSEAALALLDARLKHLNARAAMPEGKLRRLRHVLRELLTRRYHLYSNGVYSAAKDLLARSPTDAP
jgi:glycosyltransferase involved in cell wall biosynthesis